MATLLYVRPISFAAYFLSKFTVLSVIGLVSITAGFTGSVYYTVILYGSFDIATLLASFCTYYVWLVFVLAVTLLMSAAFKTTIATAFTFIVIFVGQIIDALVGSFWTISPWKIPGYGVQLIRGTMEMSDYWWSILITVILLIACIVLGIWTMKKNAAMTKI